MDKPRAVDANTKSRKAAANRGAYLAERDSKDRVLLRLNKGLAARMDDARTASGLSRSAFASVHLGLAIEALASRDAAVAAPGVADEFDELFALGSP